MTKTDTKSLTAVPMTTQRLNRILGDGASALAACTVIMWAVFNGWLNLLTYRADTDSDQVWWIAALVVVVVCVIPFLFGLVLLAKSLGSLAPKTPSS